MASLFPVPFELYDRIPDETVTCRCEQVSAGSVRESVRLGWNDLNSVKGATRAGMGLCQGRMCGPAVRALVSGALESGLTWPIAAFAARIPIKPIRYPVAAGLHDTPYG
jgi:bacterioferritin-associated ferredoxin